MIYFHIVPCSISSRSYSVPVNRVCGFMECSGSKRLLRRSMSYNLEAGRLQSGNHSNSSWCFFFFAASRVLCMPNQELASFGKPFDFGDSFGKHKNRNSMRCNTLLSSKTQALTYRVQPIFIQNCFLQMPAMRF